MHSYQNTTQLGHIGTTPKELPKKYEKDATGAKFRIATNKEVFSNRKYAEFLDKYTREGKDENTAKDEARKQAKTTKTCWMDVKCWGQPAIYALERLDVGDSVFVVGELNSYEYEGENGVKGENKEIIATNVIDLNKINKRMARKILDKLDDLIYLRNTVDDTDPKSVDKCEKSVMLLLNEDKND